MAFTWTAAYSVGITIIDEQHKKLVGLINDLHEASSVGKGKEIVGKVLKSVVDYTAMHFKTEEDLMNKFKYPDYPAHKKIHDDLVKQATDLLQKQQSGNLFISVEVMNFLQNWLVHHISDVDKRLGAFLKEKGEK